MSLRQRGQRASEASNEGGYDARGRRPPPSAPSTGGFRTPQPKPRAVHRAASATAPASAGRHGGGGRFAAGGGAGHPGTPAAPRAGAGYPASPRALHRPAAQAPYFAHPGGGGRVRRSESLPAVSTHGAAAPARPGGGRGGAGPFGSGGSSGYAGYGGGRSANGGAGAPAPANNPYQKSKASSGATCQRLFLGLLALASLGLAGTAVRFRGILKARQADAAHARRTLAEEAERAAREKGGPPRPRRPVPPGPDAQEKERLERDLRQLQAEIAAHKKRHADAAADQTAQQVALAALVARREDTTHALAHAKNVLADGTEEASKYKAMVDGLDAVEAYMTKREGALWGRIDDLQTRIERDSRREATEWFGPGPHRVELDLEYPEVHRTNPDASTWPRARGTVTLEMAPLDVMPHAVNLFLQQVHHQLWNACAVVSSADHIFQLGPSYRDEDKPGAGARAGAKRHYEHFRAKGLDKVTYQEYSAGYPHAQWTVGLAGRPGGPDFYINKRNNTQIHGPGGQLNRHDLHNEADPCFGRVVGGRETLAEIGGVPTDPERNYAFKYPVVIAEARVLAPLEGPAEGWRAVRPGEKFDGGPIVPLPDVPRVA